MCALSRRPLRYSPPRSSFLSLCLSGCWQEPYDINDVLAWSYAGSNWDYAGYDFTAVEVTETTYDTGEPVTTTKTTFVPKKQPFEVNAFCAKV